MIYVILGCSILFLSFIVYICKVKIDSQKEKITGLEKKILNQADKLKKLDQENQTLVDSLCSKK